MWNKLLIWDESQNLNSTKLPEKIIALHWEWFSWEVEWPTSWIINNHQSEIKWYWYNIDTILVVKQSFFRLVIVCFIWNDSPNIIFACLSLLWSLIRPCYHLLLHQHPYGYVEKAQELTEFNYLVFTIHFERGYRNLDSFVIIHFDSYNVGPLVINWFINPMNYSYVRIINQSESGVMFTNWTLSFFRGPHFVSMWKIGPDILVGGFNPHMKWKIKAMLQSPPTSKLVQKKPRNSIVI